VGFEDVDGIQLAQDMVQRRTSFQHCNEFSGSTKGTEFLD